MLNLAFKLELVVLPIHLLLDFVDAVALGNFCEKIGHEFYLDGYGMVTIFLLTPVTEKKPNQATFFMQTCVC